MFSTVDLLVVWISSFLYWRYYLPFCKTSHLIDEVNCTDFPFC